MILTYLTSVDFSWIGSFLFLGVFLLIIFGFYGPLSNEDELLIYLNTNPKLPLKTRFERYAKHMKTTYSMETISGETYGPDVEQALLVCFGSDKEDEDNQHVFLKRKGLWMLDF